MLKPRLPSPVKIGAWRVKVARRRALFTMEGHPADGLYHFKDHSIELARHLTTSDEREILMHELLHACFERAGVCHMMDDLTAELEEGIIRLLAPLLVEILRANPRLVSFLLTKEIAC